jgi:hypothetical protein
MSKHGRRFPQPPPTPTPRPPVMPKPGPGELRGHSPSWGFALFVIVAGAAAVVAIFFAGVAVGAVLAHG